MSKKLYKNAEILTMDARKSVTDALLVENGRIVALGDKARSEARGATHVDLAGRLVVPGMIDAHTHMESAAISASLWVDVRDLPLDEALQRIRSRVNETPAGEWIIAQGTWGQENEAIDRRILDEISQKHPIIFRPTIHEQVANSLALALANLLNEGTTPVGSWVERDVSGQPTGKVAEAFHLFPVTQPPPEQYEDILAKEIRERFNRFGVTTIYEVPATSLGVQSIQRLASKNRLTARFALQPTVAPGLQPLVRDIKDIASFGMLSGFGDDFVWFGAAKFFMDGAGDEAFDARRDHDHPRTWGTPMRMYQELLNALVVAYRSGIQLWIHAIGGTAQLQTLDAIEHAQEIVGGHHGIRMRIEHIGLDEGVSPAMLERLRKTNTIAVPTASFLHSSAPSGNYSFKTLIDAGLQPPGNSDNAGSMPFSTNPFFGLKKMVTRKNKHGELVSPEESVTPLEGLETYTRFSAYAGGKEGLLGELSPGSFADFAVLSDDFRTIAPENLDRVESVLTVVNGENVWEQ